ncbi:hypothetical protein PTTG_26588 [Puccinia triticina 1-1 BBBD Race 1]|uniref:Secreted protein n=2 Tax=Puccinia triticina TaxID=208348 RepID=A0A180GSR9_PUCT1|nr:uncharacterized protein PtA15_14A249 [Puccinia triticina]OAV95785.1 hypothetical protein PTTG_26588 [Puccinia triticina 1-1 BBBD Race 1]WAQ91366.1 hypothetical protein PtA15_14A249 [Puccinia triticina]WAR62166.1 hypothetical protein PtB15_14B260 [Puccinia triticina]
MFTAGSIWKLFVVSAVIALVGLRAVELAEVQQRGLSRRAPTPKARVQVKGSITCGDSWTTTLQLKLGPPNEEKVTPKGAGQEVSCRGYDSLGYECDWPTCYVSKDNVNHVHLLTFTKCIRYRNDGETGPPTTKVDFMHPIQFWARNLAGYLVAIGQDSGPHRKDDIIRRYKCLWSSSSDPNNQRPVCHNCTRKAFKEPKPPH